jgi:hypothetical protein
LAATPATRSDAFLAGPCRENVGRGLAIGGWHTGCACRWSTDHKWQKLFYNRHEARAVCDELRSLCPRNAEVINIEVAQDGLSPEVVPPMFETAA